MDVSSQALEAACRTRRYLHFDKPLSRAACKALVSDPAQVAKHSFFPFLRVVLERRRFKRLPGGLLERSVKAREIRYAAHADAAIYAYYNHLLSARYEAKLVSAGLGECVTAFRALGRNNAHFATEAFEWIDQHRPCVAIGVDIKAFFDSLDHSLLKSALISLLDQVELPSDYYAVFRSLTKHAAVDLPAVLSELGISRHNIRKGGVERLCSIETFRSQIKGRGMVTVNTSGRGIPQGSPISALLSNIYMLAFDKAMHAGVSDCGGLYRRYCDDILCVVPTAKLEEISAALKIEIAKLKLEVQESKTVTSSFEESGEADTALPYLGLVYDGAAIRLRSSGVARYYAKMRAGINQFKRAKPRPDGKSLLDSRKRELYKRYTKHAGRGERNFVTYARHVAVISKSKEVERQIRRHMQKFKAWSQLVQPEDEKS